MAADRPTSEPLASARELDIERLFHEHHRRLLSCVRRRFPTVPNAVIEDACAQTWLIAWRERRRVEPQNVFGWLLVVASNEVCALLKKRRREADIDSLDLTHVLASDSDPEASLEFREALRALAALNDNQRVALALRAAGYSYSEIQELLGCTYTWVNRHVTEGKRALRR